MNDIFTTVRTMSLTASYVIAFVLLLRLALRKAPKRFSYMLWVVVLFRLICPISFSSFVSVIPTETVPTPVAVIQQERTEATPPLVIPDGADDIKPIISEQAQSSAIQPKADLKQTALSVSSIVWMCGIAAIVLYSGVSLIQLKRRLKNAESENGRIFVSDKIPTAFVLGVLRPKIYLPEGLSDGEKSYITRHEEIHIRRFDHVVKIVMFVVLCVHWFNPIVWVSFVLCSRDMEMSCDERVLKTADNDIRKAYSSSLLTLAAGRRILSAAPLAFGEDSTKQRVKNIANYKKPAIWVSLCAVLAVVIAIVCLAANPMRSESTPVTITFPANDNGRMQYSESIFAINPFDVSMSLPSGAKVENADGQNGMLFSEVLVTDKDGGKLCTIGYNTFTYTPDVEESYMAVYNQLMLGSVVNWNFDYTEVNRTDDVVTATCSIHEVIFEDGKSAAESEQKITSGILAYSKSLGVYIGIQFEENAVDIEKLIEIAKSITITGVPTPLVTTEAPVTTEENPGPEASTAPVSQSSSETDEAPENAVTLTLTPSAIAELPNAAKFVASDMEEIKNEADFPNKAHVELAKRAAFSDENIRAIIKETYENVEADGLIPVSKPSEMQFYNGVSFDFDKDGEDESIIALGCVPNSVMGGGAVVYVDGDKPYMMSSSHLPDMRCRLLDYGSFNAAIITTYAGAIAYFGDTYTFDGSGPRLAINWPDGSFAVSDETDELLFATAKYYVDINPIYYDETEKRFIQMYREDVTPTELREHFTNGTEALKAIESALGISDFKISTVGYYDLCVTDADGRIYYGIAKDGAITLSFDKSSNLGIAGYEFVVSPPQLLPVAPTDGKELDFTEQLPPEHFSKANVAVSLNDKLATVSDFNFRNGDTLYIEAHIDDFYYYGSDLGSYYFKYDITDNVNTFALTEENYGEDPNAELPYEKNSEQVKTTMRELTESGFPAGVYEVVFRYIPYDGSTKTEKQIRLYQEDENGLLPYEVEHDESRYADRDGQLVMYTDKDTYSLKKLKNGSEKITVFALNLTDEVIRITASDLPMEYYKDGEWKSYGADPSDPAYVLDIRPDRAAKIATLGKFTAQWKSGKNRILWKGAYVEIKIE